MHRTKGDTLRASCCFCRRSRKSFLRPRMASAATQEITLVNRGWKDVEGNDGCAATIQH